MKQIWNHLQSKNRSLLAKQIHSYRLRNKCLQEINPSLDSSQTQRKLLKLQKEVTKRYNMGIGNKEDTYLWLDNQHPNGPLLDKYRGRIIDDSILSGHTMVKEVMNNMRQRWPSINSLNCIKIKTSLDLLQQGGENNINWIPHFKGVFSIRFI